ncbi:hypothetical protein DSO57_1009324 [Entomophthora muscae]|uniref:Uncharacterized protein n=1 Tax=Entomophthora muscae TaxID=34485 RepID=A0ACC2S8S3_9FUNG|nr:hypothetical protein DSO57_1009324 [Entomophthora muscae]
MVNPVKAASKEAVEEEIIDGVLRKVLVPCIPAPFVTSDKLLLTMLTGKSQLQDLNPDTPRAASLQDRLPTDFWAGTRTGFNFGKSFKA